MEELKVISRAPLIWYLQYWALCDNLVLNFQTTNYPTLNMVHYYAAPDTKYRFKIQSSRAQQEINSLDRDQTPEGEGRGYGDFWRYFMGVTSKLDFIFGGMLKIHIFFGCT